MSRNDGLYQSNRIDLFVTHEAMSPGEWKKGGEGMTLRYG
ncbi:MAG: 6-O-methylguanine DNA methyltransferase, partial [Candidatus Afipia apatlaquensis]|nr:6-O-methylguanine DNA methyltransferase [Candidatus Afipia apatlaquensis]